MSITGIEKRKQDNAYASILEMFRILDRILSGKPVTTHLVESQINAPAWSSNDSYEISFNSKMIPTPDTPEDIICLYALNYHELCHIVDTAPVYPNRNNALSRLMYPAGRIDSNIAQCRNILEDQRIENLWIDNYPSTKHYFLKLLQKYLYQGDQPDMLFLLTHGRKYIKQELREKACQEFISGYVVYKDEKVKHKAGSSKAMEAGTKTANDVKAIIDKYISIDPEYDLDLTAKLIKEFYEIISKFLPQSVSTMYGHCEEIGNEPNRNSASSKSNNSSSSSTKNKDEDKDGEAENSSDESAEDMLNNASNDVGEEESVKKDVKDTQVKITQGTNRSIVPRYQSSAQPVTADTHIAQRRFSVDVKRILDAADPGWAKYESSGKLDALRAALSADPETMYQRWDEGLQDITDIEMVVCCDISGSMQGKDRILSNVAWAIKRSSQIVGFKCSIFLYGSSSYVLYDANDSVSNTTMRQVLCNGGGTCPSRALAEAHRILTNSNASRRVLVMMTDGAWNEDDGSLKARGFKNENTRYGQAFDEVIKDMNKRDIITAMCYLATSYSETPNWHECKIHTTLSDLSSLSIFTNNLVKTIMQDRVKARR